MFVLASKDRYVSFASDNMRHGDLDKPSFRQRPSHIRIKHAKPLYSSIASPSKR